MSELLEMQLLKDADALSSTGLLIFEADLNGKKSGILPKRLQTFDKKRNLNGRVVFYLEDLPLRQVFITEAGNPIERLSERYISYGRGMFRSSLVPLWLLTVY